MADEPIDQEQTPTLEEIAGAEACVGLSFTPAEREMLRPGLAEIRAGYAQLRAVPLPNDVPPAFVFDPRLPGTAVPSGPAVFRPSAIVPGPRPADLEALAFAPVTDLAARIRARQVSAVALTEMYLARLRRYDPLLHCVVTLTEERALAQARRADAEIAAGRYRGPLHGIPWGAKDLLATRGIPTTWGAAPYRDQVPDYDAAVVERLDAAGAVLVAKLTLGELAWGDVWFGGLTRNPWHPEEGASGSSAGPASAVAAGLVGFALGSETHGSIVSPGTRCRVTGLRPTFGRVSRYGAMALAWTMDKLGPLARTVEDCALVFAAIHGADRRDRTAVDAPFGWDAAQGIAGRRIGYLERAFTEEHDTQDRDAAALEVLRGLGAELVPIALPDYPLDALGIILAAEAAAAFDELTRSGRDELLARQERHAWPNAFRQARLIPAVEYIQANRVRTLLMEALAAALATVDLYVVPSFAAHNLLWTNLTGHPAVVVPNGLTDAGQPASLTFVGRLYDEGGILTAAKAYQDATGFHLAHPSLPEEGSSGGSSSTNDHE